jgi:hypothetical protein
MNRTILSVCMLIVALSVAVPNVSFGQSSINDSASYVNDFRPTALNTVYLELLGNGLLYSVNFDRLITPNVSVRLGFSTLTIAGTDNQTGVSAGVSLTTIPLTASYLVHFPNSPSHI